MLTYRHVKKAFDAPVLNDVSLTVQPSEVLAIIGPSGTGKSVLLKMAIGLITPDAGEIELYGRSVVDASEDELTEMRKKVGYVFQNAALFDSLTVFENVALGIDARTRKSEPMSVLWERVGQALAAVHLDVGAIESKLPAELSFGMRKRVGIARTLMSSPDLLLYDEPVTGLDPVTAASITYLIEKTAQHSTTVLVTHNIEGAIEIIDRVALLSGGVFRFIGTPDEFTRSDDPLVRAFAHRDAARSFALSTMERA